MQPTTPIVTAMTATHQQADGVMNLRRRRCPARAASRVCRCRAEVVSRVGVYPAKLLLPSHNAAASGTLPTEQTKLIIVRDGPEMTMYRLDAERGR